MEKIEIASEKVRQCRWDEAAAVLADGKILGVDSLFKNHPIHDLMSSGMHAIAGTMAPCDLPRPADIDGLRPVLNSWLRRHPRPEIMALAGAERLMSGRYAEARKLFTKALRREKLHAASILRAASVLFESKAKRSNIPLSKCLKDLENVLGEDPDNSWALRLRADILNDLENIDGSRRDLERLLKLNPLDDWARIELADLLCDEGCFKESMTHLRELGKRHRNKGWYQALMGRALGTSGHLKKALSTLNRAVRLSPEIAPILAWRSEVLRKMGRHEEALSDLNAVVKKDPGFLYGYEWRGRLLLNLGRYREALKDLSLNERADKRHYFGPAFRGEALFKLGDFRGAALDFERCHPLDPQNTWNPELREGKGPGSKQEALNRSLKEAVERHPRNAWAWAFRGRCLATQGNLKEAAACLDKALELKKGMPYALRWKGYAFLKMGRAHEALSMLKFSKGAWAWAWRAQAWMTLGNYSRALPAFDRALRRAGPQLSVVHFWKAQALSALGRREEALREIRLAQRWSFLEQGTSQIKKGLRKKLYS